MTRLRSIRLLFPLAVLAAVVIAITLTAYLGFRNTEADVMAAAHGALARDSHRLAVHAQFELPHENGLLADEVARWVADRRAVAAAIIAPDGRIMYASQLAWQGQLASKVLPRFPQAAYELTHTLRDVQFVQPRAEDLIAILGFYHPESSSSLRPQRGAIYLEFDLSRVLEEERVAAIKSAAPVLSAFLLFSAFLLKVVDQMLTGPLARLLKAVGEFQEGRSDTPLQPEGAPEVRELTTAFANMREVVNSAMTDLARQQRHLAAAQEIARIGSWEWRCGEGGGWWTRAC